MVLFHSEDLRTVSAIRDWDELGRLAPEWDALWGQTADPYLINHRGWAELTWETPPGDQDRSLFCVVGRRGGRLSLIWPFVVRQERLWRMAQPIGTLWGDYSTVLAESSPDPALLQAAWRLVEQHCPADLVTLPFVPASSPTGELLCRRDDALVLGTLPAPYVTWQGISDFESYLTTRSPQPRRDLGRKHRRLAEKGPLDFSVITNPDDAVPAIDWMLHHKARWLERSGKEDATWIGEERFRTFLQKLMVRFGPEQRCAVLALKQGGKILAADLVSIEGSRVGWYMGTFDQEFRRHSPGHVLKEYALRWAFERGLTFDMRLGDGEHKRFWATGAETTMTLRFSISAWGRIYMAAKRVQPLLRRAPRQDVLQPAA